MKYCDISMYWYFFLTPRRPVHSGISVSLKQFTVFETRLVSTWYDVFHMFTFDCWSSIVYDVNSSESPQRLWEDLSLYLCRVLSCVRFRWIRFLFWPQRADSRSEQTSSFKPNIIGVLQLFLIQVYLTFVFFFSKKLRKSSWTRPRLSFSKDTELNSV